MDDDSTLEDIKTKLQWNPPSCDSSRFISVFMDQSTRCNLRCRTCGFSDPRAAGYRGYDMPRWLYEKVAGDVFRRATYVCLSLMAEPLMTRDFVERLEALHRFGVPFGEVITNGTLLNPRIAERLILSKLARISVSIDANRKETFEFLRTGARFEQVLAGWDALKSARGVLRLPALRINHVLTPFNIDCFDEFLRFVETLGPDEVSVRTVARMSRAAIQETTDASFWKQVCAARQSLTRFCERTRIVDSGFLRDRHTPIALHLDSGEVLTCRNPWNVIAIHPNGDAYPCFAWSRAPIGSFVTETFDEIWQGRALKSIREEFERDRPGIDCAHCRIRRAADDQEDDFFYRHLMKPRPDLNT